MRTATHHPNQADGTRIAIASKRALTWSLLTTTGFAVLTLGTGFVSGYSLWSTSAANWLLVGAGIFGTYLASRNIARGWLLLVSLQPMWVAYALVTEQYGFVIGAMAYGAGQMNGFLRSSREQNQIEEKS